MKGTSPKRLPPSSLPAGVRWRLWRRAWEHEARNALLRLFRALLGNGRVTTSSASGILIPKRFLLVRTGRAIGDMVMTLSLLSEIRRLFPDARVECVMHESLIPFFEISAGLDAIHALPRRPFLRPLAMVRLFRALRSDWSAAIVGDTPHKSSLTALCLCLAARAPRRIGFDNEESRPFLTEAVTALTGAPMRANLCRLAQSLSLEPGAPANVPFPLPRLVPAPAALAAAGKLIGEGPPPVILFASGHWSKGWPLATWLRVASRLTTEGYRTWLTFGPGDPRAADPSLGAWIKGSGGLGEILAPQSPPVLVALLSRCRGFVSNDCGPYHLAVAVGARCVAVFPTPEARRDFGYEEPSRLVAIHHPDPATAEARTLDAALTLFR